MKAKLIALTILIWLIFPAMVVIVYALFGSEEINLSLINNVMLAASIIFVILCAYVGYNSMKTIFNAETLSGDMVVSIICLIATIAAIFIHAPVILENVPAILENIIS